MEIECVDDDQSETSFLSSRRGLGKGMIGKELEARGGGAFIVVWRYLRMSLKGLS